MKHIIVLVILLFTITSCSMLKKKNTDNKREKSEERKKENKETDKEGSEEIDLEFQQPVLIDSSDYVMYPLVLEDKDNDGSILSKGYDNQKIYWNIVFYNTVTGEFHLLDSTKRMAIHSFVKGNSSRQSGSPTSTHGISQADTNMFYLITTTDHNRDENIDLKDPKYLFMSDKEGRNFKQISPNEYDVINWQLINGANKVLIHAVKDINSDRDFDKDDDGMPFIYDINTGEVKEIFSDDFKTSAEKLMEKHWGDDD